MELEKRYLEKPWLRLYDNLGVPESIEIPEIPYTEYHLDQPAKKFPNALAMVQFDYEITFRELKEKVDRFATALSALGIKKGDVVFTILPTSIQNMICDMAIPEIGAIHSPGSFLDSIDGIVDKMDRTNCNTVICCYTNVKDRDVIDKVKEAAKRHPVKNIIVTHTRDFSSSPPAHEKEEGVVWFTDLIEKYPPSPPKVDIDVKKDVAILFFTGGTTGRPKGVMLSHYNYVAQTESLFPSMLPRFLSMPLSYIGGLGGIIRCLMPLPMFHVYGHGESILVIHYGITLLCVTDPRDTKEFVRLAKKYHPLLVIGAPTQYMKLLKEEGAENLGMISLSGSMALAPEVHKAYEKKSRTIMAEGYGLSEFAPVTHVPSMTGVLAPIFGSRENVGKVMGFLNGIIDRPEISSIIKSSSPVLSSILGLLGSIRPIPDLVGTIGNRVITLLSDMVTSPPGRTKELTGSIGQLVSGMKMKIVDEETGETIPMEKVVKEGLRGEMCLDAPFKMLGYWPEVGSGMDEEGYVHTGDIVRVDDWGLTYIVDRTKDMVNISGYKVYTREIDDLLYEIPGVDEAATIGIPDPERPGSERLKVFIVLKPEYQGKIREEDIIQYLRGKVPPYAIPTSVEFKEEELPKTVTEKIFKRKLREEEIEKMKKAGVLK